MGLLPLLMYDVVNASVYAPSEKKRGDFMLVQVFLYKEGEERMVHMKAIEVDSSAERRNYMPLAVRLKHGDQVKVNMKIMGNGVEIYEPEQTIIW